MKYISPILFPLIFITSCAKPTAEKLSGRAVVNISYGAKPTATKEVRFTTEITVLEALQKVATVETHPVGERVFVSAIDSVRNVLGKNAWYYKVNGVSAQKLAISNPVRNNDTITWIYKKDVCSTKVDD